MAKLNNLSVIEYDVIMQAINNYKAQLQTSELDFTEGERTREQYLEALENVEDAIISANIPF